MTGRTFTVVGGPWSDRVGLRGRVVDGPNHYPWNDLGPDRVVVFIEDDPYSRSRGEPVWSCVLRRRDLAFDDPDSTVPSATPSDTSSIAERENP